jgi:uncharacterized protein YacL
MKDLSKRQKIQLFVSTIICIISFLIFLLGLNLNNLFLGISSGILFIISTFSLCFLKEELTDEEFYRMYTPITVNKKESKQKEK